VSFFSRIHILADREILDMPPIEFAADVPVAPSQELAGRQRNLWSLLRSEWSIAATFAFTILPWTAVVLSTAGAWAALNLLGYAVAVIAVGYSIIHFALPTSSRSIIVVLAPAVGILVLSAVTAFWLRFGLPLVWVSVVWFGFTAAGALSLWRDRLLWTKSRVAGGPALMLLSVLICAVYFVPAARNDMVQRQDGSYNWAFKDTQHFQSIAASIKNGGSPPKTPGTTTAELLYHFGSYAPAATISRLDKLDLGDALARVTHGVSIWALVLSCFAVGALLSLKANGTEFGGIAAVAGLFFYGSLLALFIGFPDSAGHWSGAVLFTIPDVFVYGMGGPFGNLLAVSSLLNGLGAITATMGLCLAAREQDLPITLRAAVLLFVPALTVPVNSVAALYCVGVAGILLFWGRFRSIRAWFSIVLIFCLFLAAWKIMGYDHAPDAAHGVLNTHLARYWWTLMVAFTVGLGFRVLAFRWISNPLKDPQAALVMASVLGFLAFFVLLQLHDGNERYGIEFLQCILSIFAFSRVGPGWWRSVERSRWATEWFRVAKAGMIGFTTCGALAGLAAFALHRNPGIVNLRPRLVLSVLLLAPPFGSVALMKRDANSAKLGPVVLLGTLLIGFLAWIPDWLNYGLERAKINITYTPGEVRGLRRVSELVKPNERFATNKHALNESVQPLLERSYGYSALSERPVLLEGYQDRGEDQLPWFLTLLHENDLLFTTTSPDTLRKIATKWQVRWLVARPGTDISIPRPLPSWLVEQQDTGDLKIYRIDSPLGSIASHSGGG
jgi:hypothetical protein